jgi:predicted amidophosphoribosyltransferase
MVDYISRRPCPQCGRAIADAATRCGYCWKLVTPLVREESGEAAAPHPNRREAIRLATERDCATIEALLDERDRRREEAAGTEMALAASTGQAGTA